MAWFWGRIYGAAVALFLFGSAGALAHSFNMVLLAPEDAGLRDAMRQAFLIASAERDSHIGQESDGHLGGLDVYLSFADPAEGQAIASLNPDILADPLGQLSPAALADMAQDVGAAGLGTTDPAAPMAMRMLQQALDPAQPSFATRYRNGGPLAQAEAVYLAARRVDLAVRALGSVDDRDALDMQLSN